MPLDPGIWVAVYGSPLEFVVRRASYEKPVTISEISHSNKARRLPSSVLEGWNGLRDFIHITVRNHSGKVVASHRLTFCPNSPDAERASPSGPAVSSYPEECASDPFQRAMVWGIARGWAVDPTEFFSPAYTLPLGTYHVTETITRRYVRLFHILARDATATVKVTVVSGQSCCGAVASHPAPPPGSPLPSLPHVASMTHPPAAALPDLVAMPSWGITTSNESGRDLLNFGATVWIGGNAPLDVEGFRVKGSPTMHAYQYFWRHGHVIGRARVGTMGFDSQHGHNHWHFQQFAEYRLLDAAKRRVVRSGKRGFCIAPTDAVDLLLRHAVWQPTTIGLGGQCGQPTALWVREELPVGWGDTYFQYVAGQSFDITNLPNGTYYIEIVANPLRVLHELTTSNDTSLRKVILGGTRGNRTVRVPAWHSIDPEN